MPDLLDDEALVEPADPDALAEGIGRAMADADFRERLRKSQAERMAGLGAGDFLDRTLDLFREA
jgi:glycosyltransferase involved in cell wall biosynthesis